MTPFEHIRKFGRDKNLSKLHERILFHKYNEDYVELVSEYKKNNEEREPSSDTMNGFERTLLSESTLSTNSRLADEEIKEYIKKEIDKVERTAKLKGFGMSILSSFLASVIFTGFLVIFFSLAQNQVKSWVNDLYSNNTYIEQKVNGEK